MRKGAGTFSRKSSRSLPNEIGKKFPPPPKPRNAGCGAPPGRTPNSRKRAPAGFPAGGAAAFLPAAAEKKMPQRRCARSSLPPDVLLPFLCVGVFPSFPARRRSRTAKRSPLARNVRNTARVGGQRSAGGAAIFSRSGAPPFPGSPLSFATGVFHNGRERMGFSPPRAPSPVENSVENVENIHFSPVYATSAPKCQERSRP